MDQKNCLAEQERYNHGSMIQLGEREKAPQHPPRNTILDIDMQPP